MSDIYNLERFIEAQNQIHESVLKEFKVGQKCGCWMWFIFPQIQGLGITSTNQKYAISCQEEARAYSEHPILGPRLRECTQLVMKVERRTAEQIFSYPDYLKFRSCMTLFEISATDNSIFRDALLMYFNGKPDQLTLNILKE